MFDVCGTSVKLSRGDSGLLTFVFDKELNPDDRGVLTICEVGRREDIGKERLRMIAMPLKGEENVLRYAFINSDTGTWEPGEYLYDFRLVRHAVEDEQGHIVDAVEVQTPFPPAPFIIEEVAGSL